MQLPTLALRFLGRQRRFRAANLTNIFLSVSSRGDITAWITSVLWKSQETEKIASNFYWRFWVMTFPVLAWPRRVLRTIAQTVDQSWTVPRKKNPAQIWLQSVREMHRKKASLQLPCDGFFWKSYFRLKMESRHKFWVQIRIQRPRIIMKRFSIN